MKKLTQRWDLSKKMQKLDMIKKQNIWIYKKSYRCWKETFRKDAKVQAAQAEVRKAEFEEKKRS